MASQGVAEPRLGKPTFRDGIFKPSRFSGSAQQDLENAICVSDDRLYFMVTRQRFRQNDSMHFFCVDNTLRYDPFFMDFGPLNLGCLFKFWKMLKRKCECEEYSAKKIYFYCSRDEKCIANASYLIGCYMVLELGMHPSDVCRIINPFACRAQPFRDASMGVCSFDCLVEHCVWSVYRALECGFLDFENFNLDDYEYYERVESGDLNIMVPNKFIAFASPNATDRDSEGFLALTPDFYLPIWEKMNVSTIVRLNKKVYDKRFFTRAGYKHYDLYYTDGTIPPPAILKKFLNICETEDGVIAVHCKAGLGRTGTCIAAYLMKHYRWTAEECIAWLRICRPGSVIGPQQSYLQQSQEYLWAEGEAYRASRESDEELQHQFEEMSMQTQEQLVDKEMTEATTSSARTLATDPGQDQGGALLNAKRRNIRGQ